MTEEIRIKKIFWKNCGPPKKATQGKWLRIAIRMSRPGSWKKHAKT